MPDDSILEGVFVSLFGSTLVIKIAKSKVD
jgi:hypothetical protein